MGAPRSPGPAAVPSAGLSCCETLAGVDGAAWLRGDREGCCPAPCSPRQLWGCSRGWRGREALWAGGRLCRVWPLSVAAYEGTGCLGLCSFLRQTCLLEEGSSIPVPLPSIIPLSFKNDDVLHTSDMRKAFGFLSLSKYGKWYFSKEQPCVALAELALISL